MPATIREERRMHKLSPRWLDAGAGSSAESDASGQGNFDSESDEDEQAGVQTADVVRAKEIVARRKRAIRLAVQQIACARTKEQAVDVLRVASRAALDRAGDWAESEEDDEDDEEALDLVGATPMMLGMPRPGSGSSQRGVEGGRPSSAASISRARSQGRR